jgi:citrate lyase beta subunit
MTTTIRTSGACRPTAPRSPTASARDAFVLTLWTNDAGLAARADAAGVDRVGVDLERLGKAERQRGLGTWISPHAERDVARLRPVLDTAALFTRVNPLNDDSAREIEAVLAGGAQVVMLPMVATPAAASRFVALVGGRAHAVLLVERREAMAQLAALAAIPGVDEIHVGLNDLALSLGLATRWAILASDRLADAGAIVRAAGKRFGFGGIGGAGDVDLPMPADLVYAEYARTGATAALVARAFPQGSTFAAEITGARARLADWRAAGAAALAEAHAELVHRAARLTVW